ncbi:MAG: N-acetylglucosamine kinase [Cyclobacteriaceae bacterium]
MILIADAGGTSVKWRQIDKNGNIRQARTSGYNATTHDISVLHNTLSELSGQLELKGTEKVFYYGAGVSSPEQRRLIAEVLKKELKTKEAMVHHDLLGAARSLLGDKPGIVCILGTGSNSCFYDGNQIVANMPSMGYVMGDEGSGNALGKRLLRAYFRKTLPKELTISFENTYDLSYNDLLSKVYTDKAGPGYLAGFSKFLFDNIRHPFVYRLIYDEFTSFFRDIVSVYKAGDQSVICFSGSIAFYYSNILRQAGSDEGHSIGNISEDSIAGLTLYHREKDL